MCPLPHFLEKRIESICNLSMEAQMVQLITRFKVTNVCLEAKLRFFCFVVLNACPLLKLFSHFSVHFKACSPLSGPPIMLAPSPLSIPLLRLYFISQKIVSPNIWMVFGSKLTYGPKRDSQNRIRLYYARGRSTLELMNYISIFQ